MTDRPQWEGSTPGPAGTGIPAGGSTGQVLTKNSGTNGDAGWATPVGAALPASRVSVEPRAGRTIRADFNDQDYMGALFDLVGMTYGTDSADSGRPVITPTTSTLSTILLKSGLMFRDMEVSCRFKAPTSIHPSSEVANLVGYLTATNKWRAYKIFNSGNAVIQVVKGASTVLSSVAQTDITANQIWKQRLRRYNGVFFFKAWKDGAVEPDWQIIARPNTGTSVRDIGLGGVAMTVYTAGSNLSDLIVTELGPPNDNAVLNGDFGWLLTSTGLPVGWTIDAGNANSTSEWVNIADEMGNVRRFAHIARTADDAAAGAGIRQSLYRRDRLISALDSNTDSGLNLDWRDARAVEVAITNWATNVRHLTHPNNFNNLGAMAVIYWGDETNTLTNVSQASAIAYDGYYRALGPNKLTADGQLKRDGNDGTGTWGPRRDVLRFPLKGGENIVDYLNLDIVLHDSDVAGDLWFGDIHVRPIA